LLKGDYARDKDGAVGALVLAECAAEQKKIGATLYDYLLDMYRSYGVYAEHLATLVCPGAKGFQQMQSIMQTLRSSPPKSLNGQEVTAVIDYSTLERREQNGHMLPVDCKAGDVVSLEFNGDKRCRITVRPSGTEPKLKFYIQWFEPASQDVAEQYRLLEKYLHTLASELEGMIVT
jgi:phosphomannomutase